MFGRAKRVKDFNYGDNNVESPSFRPPSYLFALIWGLEQKLAFLIVFGGMPEILYGVYFCVCRMTRYRPLTIFSPLIFYKTETQKNGLNPI